MRRWHLRTEFAARKKALAEAQQELDKAQEVKKRLLRRLEQNHLAEAFEAALTQRSNTP